MKTTVLSSFLPLSFNTWQQLEWGENLSSLNFFAIILYNDYTIVISLSLLEIDKWQQPEWCNIEDCDFDGQNIIDEENDAILISAVVTWHLTIAVMSRNLSSLNFFAVIYCIMTILQLSHCRCCNVTIDNSRSDAALITVILTEKNCAILIFPVVIWHLTTAVVRRKLEFIEFLCYYIV